MQPVAAVMQRDRLGAVTVDDEVCVLDNLPGHLDGDGHKQPRAERFARKQEPQHEIEDESMQDVRERVPVEQLLRVFRTAHVPDPEADRVAGADRRAPHRVEDEGLRRDQAEPGKQERP